MAFAGKKSGELGDKGTGLGLRREPSPKLSSSNFCKAGRLVEYNEFARLVSFKKLDLVTRHGSL